MTTIAGSSRYYSSAQLAYKQGSIAGTSSSFLGSYSTQSLLDSGRMDTGIGASSSARAINSQLISASNSGFNKVFSLNGVEFGTNETLAQKIKAIRANIPESKLSNAVRGSNIDTQG